LWNEVVVFLPAAEVKSARRRIEDALNPVVVDRGGLHVLIGDKPVEIYFDEPTWDSYEPEEQQEVRELLPDAEPVLLLFFDREALLEVLRVFEGAQACVDDGRSEGLVLTSLAEYTG